MDSSEMEDIFKEVGWIPIERTRRNRNVYVYASKRKGGRMVERYIAPLSKVQEMSTEQFRNLLIEKISK